VAGESAARGAPLFKVRRSRVHGRGAFAARRIRKGTRIVEYLGERVSHEEADRRYEDHGSRDSHTFLFIVDARTVIDAGVGGNEARFINHSCNPNCETVMEGKRVFIEAVRAIQPGEELNYDYQLGRAPDDPPDVDAIYACRCGEANCRGTMLWPPKKAPRRTAPRPHAARRAKGAPLAKSAERGTARKGTRAVMR
jgi:SET domain-containing protein